MADEDAGTVPVEEMPDSEQPTTDLATEDATPAETTPSAEQAASFLDDAEVMARIRANPELNHVFGKMQGSYTKKMQHLSRSKQETDLLSRFNTDPDFARQVIEQRATQLGLQVGQPATSQQQGPPADMVEAVKPHLAPELQWMAPQIAKATWAIVQGALQPMQQQVSQDRLQSRQRDYEAMAADLTRKSPGWEAHEDDMQTALSFLNNPDQFQHTEFPSKLEILHWMVTRQDKATTEAARRMADAARNRTVTGQVARPAADNVRDLVLKPKARTDAFAAAAKAAMAEMERAGLQVPD